MHRNTWLLLLIASAGLTGCQPAQIRPAGPADRTPLVRVDPKRISEADAPLIAEPTGVITLRDVLALAVSRNPELGVFPYELRAADARALQAGLRPNPELAIEIEEFAGRGGRRGFDGAETTVRIDQPIELGGKRDRRLRVAQLDRELTGWDYESARLDVIHEATHAFFAVLAAQNRVELAQRLLQLSRREYFVVAQRVEAGRDSPVDELRANVVLHTSRIELQRAQRALAAARHALAAVWGARTAGFEAVAGDLHEVSAPVPPADAAAAIAANPDLARWETQERRQRAALRLEQANAVPDMTVGGGVQRFEETNDSALVFGLAVPIPLFDRNQGGIREAVAELARTRRQYEAVQVRTLAALSEAVNARAAAYEEVTILRDDVLPRAEQAFQAAEEGYRQGRFDFLHVLDAQRTLFETQAAYIDAAQAYHQAQADVQRLTGSPPTDVREDPSIPNRESSSQENPNEE
jgi:outer membrane protein, heavy metal efflux system